MDGFGPACTAHHVVRHSYIGLNTGAQAYEHSGGIALPTSIRATAIESAVQIRAVFWFHAWLFWGRI
jgi:hypothetical protein